MKRRIRIIQRLYSYLKPRKMNWEKLLNGERIRKSKRTKDVRNEFESDLGRIIFSPATRRMHDKTQVFPLTTDDNIHSRLTHSLEVMSIGYSLGIKVCENKSFQEKVGKEKADLFREIPILLKNACLVHDIGNPPFGHFGETVIKNYFEDFFKKVASNTHPQKNNITLPKIPKECIGDFTSFDGNAQGFRVLTKLQILNDKYGLNLTYSTLATFLKYPNYKERDKANISTKKRGVFWSEAEYLDRVAENCGLLIKGKIRRHPFTYLMEAADSICYFVMDMEDGYNKGWYSFIDLKEVFKNVPGTKEYLDEILKETHEYGDEITKVAKLRIHLIQTLVDLATKNFLNNLDVILNGEYNKELIYDDENKLAKTLEDFCINEVYPKREITSLELTGHSVICGLLDYYINFVFNKEKDYIKRAEGLISKSILRAAFAENELPEDSSIRDLDDYYKLRVIVDYITGMTDQFAINQYQKLSGQKIR